MARPGDVLSGAAPRDGSGGVVARHCGVSNTTVLRWIGAGELAAFRLPGGHYRIDDRDLAAFSARYGIPPYRGTPGRGGAGKAP
jgi:excisionase family DNA binding protein